MSLSQKLLRSVSLSVLVLLGALLAMPATLPARDMTEYGRYLGTRLRLYQDAYETLDKVLKSGTEPEKRRARQVRAEVMKHEADYLYSLDGDVGKRNDRYEDALKVFGDPAETDHQGVLDKALMQLAVAKAFQRSNPESARDACDKAITALGASRLKMEEVRGDEAAFRKIYAVYSKTYFNYCVGFYVKSLSYDLGSSERLALLREAEERLNDFQFGLEDPTEELILSYELLGDMEIARGHLEAAVGKFIDLVKFVADITDPNDWSGNIALRNGYLRAAELQTTDLDFDTRYLQQCLDLYAQAFTRYGSIRELDTLFKSYQLYRISALIKMGDAKLIESAIESLFRLAQDKDGGFRRQALTVLADIAMRDKLDNELRFKCATAAYKELANLPVAVMIRLAMAHQALLASCSDVQTFETYGPACLERAGDIYARMWRFLDAAMVYREACTRTAYFRTKFTEDSPVPAHMLGRTDMIKDGKTLFGFPGEMANLYAKNAGFLVHARYGEPGNREFEKIAAHANSIKAKLGGDEAVQDLNYTNAEKLIRAKSWGQSAVRFASMPAAYRKYYLGLNYTAQAYYELAYDPQSQRMSSTGAREERETEEWFTEQRARHATDLARLPESMWKGQDSHWDAIMNRETAGPAANWHKALYYYKKYFLIEALRNWAEIEPLLKDKPNPDYLDGIFAVAAVRNSKWLQANPTGRGEADTDARRIGIALYIFAFMLRNPVESLGDAAARSALKDQARPEALRVLSQFWKLFGTHLEGRDVYKQKALQMAFYALCDAKDADGAEEAYLAYLAAFPDDAKEIGRMVAFVYTLIIDSVQPRSNAMMHVASNLRSRSNQMKKGAFNAVDATRDPEGAKKFAEAKTDIERHRILAQHFWDFWVIKAIFESDSARNSAELLPDVLPLLKQRWDELAQSSPERWGDAVKASLDDLLKKDSYKPARALLEKETAGVSKFELASKIKALRDKGGLPDDQMQAVSSLYTALTIDTEQLRYFQGVVFVYEFGGFLEKVAADIDERNRPLITRILKYFEEYRVRTGKAAEGLDQKSLRTLGEQYFRVRDWGNAIRYLQEYVDKHGTTKDYGKEEEIEVGRQSREAGRQRSGEELAIKYQLGKAYLERYKEKPVAEDLRRAALLMRRCWCFNLVRDANEIGNKAFKLRFQSEIEDYYLYIGQSMAEIFQLLEAAPEEIKVEWPKYANQYTTSLEVDKDNPLQAVPTSRSSALWHAREIHLRLWSSFKRLDYYQYRTEFRDSLLAWMQLGSLWLGKYAKTATPTEPVRGGIEKHFSEAVTAGRNESLLSAAYLNEDTKAYLARLKTLTDELEAACKAAGLKIS